MSKRCPKFLRAILRAASAASERSSPVAALLAQGATCPELCETAASAWVAQRRMRAGRRERPLSPVSEEKFYVNNQVQEPNT